MRTCLKSVSSFFPFFLTILSLSPEKKMDKETRIRWSNLEGKKLSKRFSQSSSLRWKGFLVWARKIKRRGEGEANLSILEKSSFSSEHVNYFRPFYSGFKHLLFLDIFPCFTDQQYMIHRFDPSSTIYTHKNVIYQRIYLPFSIWTWFTYRIQLGSFFMGRVVDLRWNLRSERDELSLLNRLSSWSFLSILPFHLLTHHPMIYFFPSLLDHPIETSLLHSLNHAWSKSC